MKILTRYGTTLLALAMFLLYLPLKVEAVTLVPASGTMPANGTTSINITANPENGETGVRLSLIVSNAKIVGFTPNSTVFGSYVMPDCNGGINFTDNQLCVTMASAQVIPNGALIGTMILKWGSVGTATIHATDNNSYQLPGADPNTPGTTRQYLSTVGTYPLSSIPSTPLLSSIKDEYLFIIGGAGLIVLGIYLRKRAITQRQQNERNY